MRVSEYVVWSGIVSFLGSIQSIRLKSLNLISKLELDTVLGKREKKKITRCAGCGGYITLPRTRLDLIMIIILLKNLISRDNKLVLSPITCFTCNRI